jgi:hypothetical protein
VYILGSSPLSFDAISDQQLRVDQPFLDVSSSHFQVRQISLELHSI